MRTKSYVTVSVYRPKQQPNGLAWIFSWTL